MIRRWEHGRATIDGLIGRGRLTRIEANHELAEAHVARGATHPKVASSLRDLDPAGAFTLAYDAARLALAAALVNQGLRPRGGGPHS